MKRSLPLLVSTLCASVALADPPAPQTATQKAASALVEKQLVARLRKAESKRSRFSRSGPVAVQRRVRVGDTRKDARGKEFVRFAIDTRFPWNEDDEWQTDAILGCAYPSDHQVFVQRDEDYVPARTMLGEDGDAVPEVCRAAAEGVEVAVQ